METQKRQILLEKSIDRVNPKTWGTLTATTFYLNVLITQNIDDMGLFTDMPYIEKSVEPVNYRPLILKLLGNGGSFPFMSGQTPNAITNLSETDKRVLRLPDNDLSSYYRFGGRPITGSTDSKLEDVRSYSNTNPYRVAFDVKTENYYNYENELIIGVDRIKTFAEPKIYVFDTPNDVNLGTPTQQYGIQYLDYTGVTRYTVIDGIRSLIPTTIFRYIGEGINETNVSLSAITKEEYLFGIISKPEIKSDLFIDRDTISVMDYHLRMSEIKNIGQLTRYGNGFFKINKQ